MINNPYLWGVFANFIENLIITYFLFSSLRFSEGRHKKLFAVLAPLFFTILVSLFNSLQINAAVTQAILYILRFLLILYYFCNSIAEKIFINCLPNFASLLARQFTYTLGIWGTANQVIDRWGPVNNPLSLDYVGDHPILSASLYLFFEFVFMALFVHILGKIIHIPSKMHIFLIITTIVALISATGLLNIVAATEFFPLPVQRRTDLNTLCFIVLFLFITMVSLVQIIGNTYERNLTLLEQLHQNEMIEERNKSLLQSVESLRKWKHDYRNHLSVMQELLANENYERLKEYIDVQKDTLPQSFSEISTGHTIVDDILTKKYAEMKTNGISFGYSVLLPEHLPLSDIEVTGVLGNLLDNAIAACMLCTQEMEAAPSVTLSIKPQRGIVHICVKNTSTGNYHYGKNGMLETTKADKSFHGNGLKQIHSIVESRGGFCKITAADTDFMVDVVIPLEQEEETA